MQDGVVRALAALNQFQPGTNLSGNISSVAFDGTTFVVTGGTSIYTSTDAVTWTANGVPRFGGQPVPMTTPLRVPSGDPGAP